MLPPRKGSIGFGPPQKYHYELNLVLALVSALALDLLLTGILYVIFDVFSSCDVRLLQATTLLHYDFYNG